MNLQEMRTFITDYIGETITGFRTTAQLNNWCNGVYRKIIRGRNDWNWMTVTKTISLQTGVTAYKLPDDCLLIKEVKVDGDTFLGINYHEVPFYESGGHYFYVLGTDQGDRYLHLLETPSADGTNNLSMIYLFSPPEMDEDTDSPLFPTVFHDIIPTFVCYLATRKEDDPVKEEYLKEYSDGMKRLVSWDRTNGVSGYKASDRFIPYTDATQAEDYRDNY